MPDMIKSAIPMWRVQFHLLGGMRKMVFVLTATVTIIVAGTIVVRRVAAGTPFTTVAGWITVFLAWAQSAILVLAGSNMIYRAIVRDVDSRMIESHRLSPMTNLGVALGYLFGPTQQVLAVFLTAGLGGAIIGFIGQIPLGPWGIGHAVLLTSAITLWALVVFSGMKSGKPLNPGGLIIAVSSLSLPLSFVPGAAILLNIYSVMYGMYLLMGKAAPHAVITAITFAVCAAMILYWLAVAAVKYRRPDLPALGSFRGLILLAILVVLGMIGLAAFEELRSRFVSVPTDDDFLTPQWIVSLVMAVCLAAIPIGGAVQCRMLAARGAALRDWTDRISDVLVVLLAAIIVLSGSYIIGWKCWHEVLPIPQAAQRAWGYTGAAVLVGLLTLRPVFVLVQRYPKSASALVGAFVLIVWGFPPLIDLIRAEQLATVYKPPTFSFLMGLSPIGTLIAAWADIAVPLIPGITFQVILLSLLWIVAARFRRRWPTLPHVAAR